VNPCGREDIARIVARTANTKEHWPMIRILTDALPDYELPADSWFDVLKLAHFFGWEPEGTSCVGAGPHWNGEYAYAHWYAIQIVRSDAEALRDALSRAVPHLPESSTPPEEVRRVVHVLPPRAAIDRANFDRTMSRMAGSHGRVRDVIRMCGHAPLQLAPDHSHIGDYCYCPELWSPVPQRDCRERSVTGSDWLPEAGFPLWFIVRAIRGALEGPCHGRHPHCRAGLAQAICGYLDEHPDDAVLSDPDLLLEVAARYYGVRDPTELVSLDEDSDGWSRPLADAFRQARSNGPRTVRPPAATSPWWRAAHILGGSEVELAAVVMEHLWRRRNEVRCSGERFGWGQDVTVELPVVGLDAAQHDVFGWTETWPLPLARITQLNLGDPSVPKLLWEVAGRGDTYPDVTSDLESWEQVSGLTETDLFPERAAKPPPPASRVL
jgi:hypothetical protein